MVAGAAGGVMLFVLVGLNPAGDVLAHAFGFGSGLLPGAGWCGCRALDPEPLA